MAKGNRMMDLLMLGVVLSLLVIVVTVAQTYYTPNTLSDNTSQTGGKDRALLYVANEELKVLTAMDVDSSKVVFTVLMKAEVREVTLVKGKWGRFIYVSDISEDNIVSVEATTGKIWGTYPSGRGTLSLTPHPSGEYVYVINTIDHSVTIMDVNDHKELKRRFLHEGTFYLGQRPLYGVFTPDYRFWYTDAAKKMVGVVRVDAQVRAIAPWDVAVDLETLAEIPLESAPANIATAKDGSKVLVGVERGLAVVDAKTYKIMTVIALEESPASITTSPDGAYFYVANSKGVYIIDASTHRVITLISMEGGAYGLAATPSGERLYASNPRSGTVTIVDAKSLRIIGRVEVGGTPMGVALFSISEAR